MIRSSQESSRKLNMFQQIARKHIQRGWRRPPKCSSQVSIFLPQAFSSLLIISLLFNGTQHLLFSKVELREAFKPRANYATKKDVPCKQQELESDARLKNGQPFATTETIFSSLNSLIMIKELFLSKYCTQTMREIFVAIQSYVLLLVPSKDKITNNHVS